MSIYICIHLYIQPPNQIIDPAGSLLSHVTVWVLWDRVFRIFIKDSQGPYRWKRGKEAGLGRRCHGVMQDPQLLPHPQKTLELKESIKIALNWATMDSPWPLSMIGCGLPLEEYDLGWGSFLQLRQSLKQLTARAPWRGNLGSASSCPLILLVNTLQII